MVTESAAICAYLADASRRPGCAAATASRLRGPYYRWLFFAAGPLEAAVTNKTFGFEVPAERETMVGYGSYDAVHGRAGAAPSRAASTSSATSFTAADVYVGSQIGWGMKFGSIEKRPAFERYWERLAAAQPRCAPARSTTR